MKTIFKNLYDILFWGAFASFIGLGGYVFGVAGKLAATIAAL